MYMQFLVTHRLDSLTSTPGQVTGQTLLETNSQHRREDREAMGAASVDLQKRNPACAAREPSSRKTGTVGEGDAGDAACFHPAPLLSPGEAHLERWVQGWAPPGDKRDRDRLE